KGTRNCAFSNDSLEENLIEQFIRGVRDESMQQKLIANSTKFKKLDDPIQIATAMEAASNATFRISSEEPVNKIDRQRKFEKPTTNKNFSKRVPKNSQSSQGKRLTFCYRCGNPQHLAPDCPHISHKCTKCNTVGHLEKSCQKSKKQSTVLHTYNLRDT